MSEEIVDKLQQKIDEYNALDYKHSSKVKEAVTSLIRGYSTEDAALKAISTRLPLRDYARLKILSSRLNISLSNLARIILIEGLADAIAAYQSSIDEDALIQLDEDFRDAEAELFVEAQS